MSEPAQGTSIGDASMDVNGTITLRLRATGKGGLVGDGLFVIHPGDPKYNDILKHLGGLEPGQEKRVPPWPEVE